MSNTKIVNSQQTKNDMPLEELWYTVRNNPNDFNSWTLLLQYCENTKNIESIRKSFNEFLSKYPNCYIYWKKLAEYELVFSDHNSAIDVLERAVESFPISIDIWIHYIQFYLKYNSNQKEILLLFERAVRHCGQDFNSSDLWTEYLKWLTSNRHLSEVIILYERLFKVSLKTLSQHFEDFKSFVNNNHPIDIIDQNEYNSYVRQYFEQHSLRADPNQNQLNGDISNEDVKPKENDLKIQFIRQKIIDRRKPIFELTLEEVNERKVFEDGIKRPYFHVNPLDLKQLDNWMRYLNWQIKRNVASNVIYLFERCLVACALYEHMWIKYSNYLIEKRYQLIKTGEEFFENFNSTAIRSVFRRAADIHIRNSFKIRDLWSLFEEREGNFDEAFDILDKFEKTNQYLLETTISKINLLLRKRDLIGVENHFKSSIEKFKDCPKLSSHLSIKYSRFLNKVTKNFDKAVDVLQTALKSDPNNYVLYLRLIDIEYQKTDLNANKIENLFNKMIDCIQSNSLKLAMTQNKLEFMKDFGFESEKIQNTIFEIQSLSEPIPDQSIGDSKTVKRLKIDRNLVRFH